MESHLVRIINRLETMTKDGGNLKRNFERDGVVVAEVAYNHNEEEGSTFTLRDVEARETYAAVWMSLGWSQAHFLSIWL